MDDDIMSMMRALLEAQERGLAYAQGMEPLDENFAHGNHSGYGAGHNAWEPTSHHGFDLSYPYQGEPYAQENHNGYDAGYQSWEPPSNNGFAGSDYYQGGLYDQANQGGFDAGYQSGQPTSFQGFAPSSDSQGGPYAPEHQSGYEEAYPPWDMQYDHGETTSSTLSTSEDTYNMMKMLLESQTRSLELINSFDFGTPSLAPTTSAAATEHMESFTTTLTTWNAGDDEDSISIDATTHRAIPPIDMGERFEETAQLNDEFLQEEEWTVTEMEFLLGSTVDENIELRYDDPVPHVVSEEASHGGLVVECNADALVEDLLQEPGWSVPTFEDILGCTVEKPLQRYDDLLLTYATIGRRYEQHVDHGEPLSFSPLQHGAFFSPSQGGFVVACNGEAFERSLSIHPLLAPEIIHMPHVSKLEHTERHTADESKANLDIGPPLVPPFADQLSSLPPHPLHFNHSLHLPFEDIRMKEFGGWFYDEYDPGDPQFCRVHLDKSFSQA